MLLKDIELDSSLQVRESLDQEVINDYSEALREGARFPAITVFRVGTRNLLVDGWHRYYAHKKAGLADIEADIIEGSSRDATLCAIGANDSHGLRRSNNDKRKAVMMLLDDLEWAEWSDRKIAQVSKVSTMTVGRIRKSLGLQRDEVKAIVKGKETTVKVNRNDEFKPEPQELEEEISQEIAEIVEDNENLKRRLAVAAMEATDEEKGMAEAQLVESASKIKTLEAELFAVKANRDRYMNENAELKRQVASWKRKAEKAEKELEKFAKLGIKL
jgi:hypothetical protein